MGKKLFSTIPTMLVLVLSFQNCGEGFSPLGAKAGAEQSSLSSEQDFDGDFDVDEDQSADVFSVVADTGAGAAVDPTSIMDFAIMDVCVDSADKPINGDPAKCARKRNLKVGEKLPYFRADYGKLNEPNACRRMYGYMRRYVFPAAETASDQTGRAYPVAVHYDQRDLAYDQSCNVEPDWKDPSLLSVFGGYARLVAGINKGRFGVTFGNGYADNRTQGIARFDNSWVVPAKLPAMNEMGYVVMGKKTEFLGTTPHGVRTMPQHLDQNPNVRLSQTFTGWKRLRFSFGPGAGHPGAAASKSLDTIVNFGYARSNATKDGVPAPPAKLPGTSEHIYWTREYGYATRWENWHPSDTDPEARAKAGRVYAKQNCSKPASMAGRLSPHLTLDQLKIEEFMEAGVKKLAYRQDMIVTGEDGKQTRRAWYMVGCVDLTNVHALSRPLDLNAGLPLTQTFGLDFLNLLMISKRPGS